MIEAEKRRTMANHDKHFALAGFDDESGSNPQAVAGFFFAIGGLVGLALIVSSIFVVVGVDILLGIYLALLGSLVLVVVLLLAVLWVLVKHGKRP